MLVSPQETERLDPRVKRTRHLIEQTFQQLMKEKTFSTITVQDITAHAEINRATFYAHYPDKFALFESILRGMFKAELDRRTLKTCTYTETNLHALMVTVCEFVALSGNNCKAADPQFESLVEAQVRYQVQGILEMWVGQIGQQPAETSANNATAATWAMYGLAQQWALNRDAGKPDAERYTHSVLPIIRANLHAA